MAKAKTNFFCQNCGNQSAKWIGKCPSCMQWNTYLEEVVEKQSQVSAWVDTDKPKKTLHPVLIHTIEGIFEKRVKTKDEELNRVLGGGIVAGSLILLGGEPGIGKSTLLLQMALKIDKKVIYISGEESETQVKMRADRIGIENEHCFIFPATEIQAVFQAIKKVQPDVVVIDSIQTLYSNQIEATPGSVSQIRECAGEFLRFAKESNIPVFLIGHITKDGQIAGPKILEHMVDTVLQFEGDRHYSYRILRTLKNRFGSASELGIYEMKAYGLREINNPSELLITQRESQLSGITISGAMEGLRPLLIETQALVSSAVYGTPQRNANGFDIKRLNMLLAVLEKRCGFFLATQDVFVNIAGGIKIDDPAIDLGIAIAILSSFHNKAIEHEMVFCGELGLSGEIRAVSKREQRILEAQKLGFKDIIVSKFNKDIPKTNSINIHTFSNIEACVAWVLG